MNVARTAMIAAGLPVETSAMTVNRYCSSGLQTIALAADRIATGGADVIVAGGLETMSMIPMGGNVVRPNPAIVDSYPDYYLNMERPSSSCTTMSEGHILRSGDPAALVEDADVRRLYLGERFTL